MALVLHKTPAEINFSNDPIVLGFTTDALNVSAGTQAVNLVEFTLAMSEGNILVLRWAGKEIRYEAKDTPVLSNELPTGTMVLATLLPYFANNHTIQEDFTVVIDTGKLKFTSKKAGAAYNFSVGAFDAGNITNSVAGVDPVVRQNFSVWLEVTVASEVVYQEFVPVNADSKAEVDLSDVLHSLLSPDMPADMANVQKCTKSVKTFSIRYAEVFGIKPQIQLITTGASYMVMLGGSSQKNRKTPAQLLGATASEDPCLRFGSPIRYTYVDEDQFLYFSALRAAGTFNAKIEVTYIDDDTHEINTAAVALLKNEKAFFNVGYAALDLGSLPIDVKLYTVTIYNVAAQYSKSYTFILDYAFHRYRRHFGYQTSLGAVDCLTTYGKQSREMEYFKEQAERVLDESTGDLNQFIDYKIELQESYQVATGFKTPAEIAFMRDFYLSPGKWRLNQAWLPIAVNKKKILEAKDGDNLYAHSFEYVYAWRDDGFSESDIDSEIMPSPPPGFLGGGSIIINTTTGEIAFDAVPVELSTKAVFSGGVYAALQTKENLLPSGSTLQFFRGDKTLGNLTQEVIASGDPRYFFNNTFGNTNKPLYTAIIDAAAADTLDPLATTPGELRIGTLKAETILFGNDTSASEFSGSTLFKAGAVDVLKGAAPTGLFWKNSGGSITDQFSLQTNGTFLLKASGDLQGVRMKTSEVYDSQPTTFIWPDESNNFSNDELNGITSASRTIATREWATVAIGNPWRLGGNGLIDGDQVIGFGGQEPIYSGETISGYTDYIGNLHIELYGSKVATFTPEGNHLFGYQSGGINPLAVGHFHANVIGDTEVALFRASNASVSNYFGVSVDPTTNTVLLRNSGTLKVKNSWQFDSPANFTASPTTINATTSAQVPNWGQVQALVSLGFSFGSPVKTVSLTSLTKSGLYAISGYTPGAGERVLDASGTAGSGVWITAAGAWTRATTEDSDPEIRNKGYLVTAGTYINTQWANNNASAITLNTTPITYVQISGQETDPIFTAHAAFGINATLIGNWNNAYTLASADYTPGQIDTFIAGLNTSISAINTKLNSGSLLNRYIPKWDGSKFVNSGIEDTGTVLNFHKPSTIYSTVTFAATQKAVFRQDAFSFLEISSQNAGSIHNYVGLYHDHLPSFNNTFEIRFGSATKTWKEFHLYASPSIYGVIKPGGAAPATSQVLWSTSTSAMQWKTLLIEDITSLATTLDGKSNIGHTHDTGDITDWDTAWDAKITAFIGAAPAALDTWNELVAEIQDNDSAIAGINSSISAINTKFNSAALTAQKYPKWDGSKFVNGLLFEEYNGVKIGASPYGSGNLVVTSTPTRSPSSGAQIVAHSGGKQLSIGFNGSTNEAWLQTSWPFVGIYDVYKLLLQPHGGNVGIGHAFADEKVDLNGNLKISGVIKPGGAAPAAGKILKGLSDTVMEWGSLTETEIIQTHFIPNPANLDFEREIHGLYFSNEEDEAFLVGTDTTNGRGVFRSKYWSDNQIKVYEHTFDQADEGRFGRVVDGEFRPYAFKDEIVPSSSGGIPTLQQVVTAGNTVNGGSLILKSASQKPIPGIEFQALNGNVKGLLNYNENTDSVALAASTGTLNISAGNGIFLQGRKAGSLDNYIDMSSQIAWITMKSQQVIIDGFLSVKDTLFIADGKHIQVKDTGNGNLYKITVHNGVVTATAI